MLKKICLGLALSWTGIILYLCLIRASDIPSVTIPYVDKCVHVVFYFVFSFGWFFALTFYFKSLSQAKKIILIFLMSLFFGIMIELFQSYFTDTRSGDIMDVLANTTGSLLAILAIKILDKNGFLRKIEK